MMALAGGLVALILGIIGIIAWWPYFVKARGSALRRRPSHLFGY
jgi:hypothetical protein